MTIAKHDLLLMGHIADRAIREARRWGHNWEKLEVMMDLEAVHEKMGLDLKQLSNAPDFDFCHDVFGIRQHLNRETRELEDCFLPRCARKVSNGKAL